MHNQILIDPWFWAFLAAVGWGLGFGVVGSKKLGDNHRYGIFMLILAELPRLILPLHFVSQPRIEPNPPWLMGLGSTMMVISL